MARATVLTLALLPGSQALHMVLSRGAALTMATRWRDYRSISKYFNVTQSLKCDDVVPILQHDDVRGLALMTFRKDQGHGHRVLTHLSDLTEAQEVRSTAEAALWIFELTAKQDKEAQQLREVLESVFNFMRSESDYTEDDSDAESLVSEYWQNMEGDDLSADDEA
jgi:hypothetical protein